MPLRKSGEDYLEAILVLKKKKGMVRSADVARHLEVSKPSVCHAVAILKKGGFLLMDGDHFLHLTDVGREVAEQIYEKHRFFTEMLTNAGVDSIKCQQDNGDKDEEHRGEIVGLTSLALHCPAGFLQESMNVNHHLF